jgi:hypothetical protein
MIDAGEEKTAALLTIVQPLDLTSAVSPIWFPRLVETFI